MSDSRSTAVLWVETHGDALFAHALLRLACRADAEDAVQETLLAALRSEESFRGDSSERTWLHGILSHKIIDRQRARTKGEVAEAFSADDEFFDSRNRWRKDPAKFAMVADDLVESAEFRAQFADCLQGLPPRQAAVFVASAIEGQNSELVCKENGVSTTNYWVLIHRARLALRACLEHTWFSEVK
ncbi:MAG: sigma-70 family RNA polymerase sigma factor [Planctomycetota bacterium]